MGCCLLTCILAVKSSVFNIFYDSFKAMSLQKADFADCRTGVFRAADLTRGVNVFFTGAPGLPIEGWLWRDGKRASCKQKPRARRVPVGRSSPAACLRTRIREWCRPSRTSHPPSPPGQTSPASTILLLKRTQEQTVCHQLSSQPCHGLILPDVEAVTVSELVSLQAVHAHLHLLLFLLQFLEKC